MAGVAAAIGIAKNVDGALASGDTEDTRGGAGQEAVLKVFHDRVNRSMMIMMMDVVRRIRCFVRE